MKFVFLSDTHCRHNEIKVPEGDCFVFCGDMSYRGELSEIEGFSLFLQRLPHRYKIVIAGNHDFSFEDERKNQAEELIKLSGAEYLNDSGMQIDEIKIWGSPIQPYFYDWAFNRERGEEIKKHWDLIPKDTDVLITHGPPKGILDKTKRGEEVGCEELLKKVLEVKPKIHAFGHIHEGYGTFQKNETVYINASNLNFRYLYTNPPIEWEL